MFVVTEAAAAAIRAIFEQEGELSAAIELRRLFPGVTDNAKARACARTIAGWKPLPVFGGSVTRSRWSGPSLLAWGAAMETPSSSMSPTTSIGR
jgi:hypothetical protein